MHSPKYSLYPSAPRSQHHARALGAHQEPHCVPRWDAHTTRILTMLIPVSEPCTPLLDHLPTGCCLLLVCLKSLWMSLLPAWAGISCSEPLHRPAPGAEHGGDLEQQQERFPYSSFDTIHVVAVSHSLSGHMASHSLNKKPKLPKTIKQSISSRILTVMGQ